MPLLKDMFGSERRKAKVLNFSIAYGKTAHGLARDWGTSLQEAEATVERWYADRPEVRAAALPSRTLSPLPPWPVASCSTELQQRCQRAWAPACWRPGPL